MHLLTIPCSFVALQICSYILAICPFMYPVGSASLRSRISNACCNAEYVPNRIFFRTSNKHKRSLGTPLEVQRALRNPTTSPKTLAGILFISKKMSYICYVHVVRLYIGLEMFINGVLCIYFTWGHSITWLEWPAPTRQIRVRIPVSPFIFLFILQTNWRSRRMNNFSFSLCTLMSA